MTTQNPQLAGLDALEGPYVFDLRVSNRTLAINRFFGTMIHQWAPAAFLADEEAAFTAAGLSEPEKVLIRNRDWLGLIQYGVNFFVLEKWARVVKHTNLQVYAIMRGETFEAFMATRNVPEMR